MTRQRWPFQATESDKKLIDEINAARPLDRTSVADGIRYGLRFTVENDQEVKAMETRYLVQHAGAAFGDVREIRKWQTIGEFATLRDADAEVAACAREMKARCGRAAWDDHFRVVPTADTTICYRYLCLGPIIGDPPYCEEHADVSVTVPWPAGEVRPFDGDVPPEGWGSVNLCPVCAKRERLAIERLEE